MKRRACRVFTPRHTYDSLAALANDLGCHVTALYTYLERSGEHYALKPLRETTYRMWHDRVHQQQRGMPYDHVSEQRPYRARPHAGLLLLHDPPALLIGVPRPDEPDDALLLCWAGALQGRTEYYEYLASRESVL